MTDLTDDEFSILLIASKGESMMPIGRWEKPVEDLVAKGFLKQHDRNNNTITPKGRVALEKRENVDARALIEVHNANAVVGTGIRGAAEKMSGELKIIAEQSHMITGDDVATAARRWSDAILTRALELLGERK